MSFFPLGGWHPCKQASKLVSRNTQVPKGAEAGAPKSTPSQGLAAFRIPCRAPSHACSRPRCEHQEYESAARSRPLSMRTTYVLCFSASEFPASWPDTDEDFTRVDESPRHTPRQRPEGNSSPRRAASTRHNLWRCGFRGFLGDRSHAPRSSAGACLRALRGIRLCANPIQYVRICYINIVLGGIGSALRHNVNDGNRGAL